MMRKLFKILRTFLGLNKKSVELPKQSNTTDLLQAATTELVGRAEQVKEDRYFKRANNIIDEFQYDHPTIITPMGVYYKPNDPRNTYDPNVVHEVEDYDGRIMYIGGAGNTTLEVYTPEDNINYGDMPENKELQDHVNKLREEWKETNKVVSFVDYVRKNPMIPQEAFSKPDKSTDNDINT